MDGSVTVHWQYNMDIWVMESSGVDYSNTGGMLVMNDGQMYRHAVKHWAALKAV